MKLNLKFTNENLYIRLKSKMYATSLNILKDTQDAEDSVANTFVKIAENFHLLQQNRQLLYYYIKK